MITIKFFIMLFVVSMVVAMKKPNKSEEQRKIGNYHPLKKNYSAGDKPSDVYMPNDNNEICIKCSKHNDDKKYIDHCKCEYSESDDEDNQINNGTNNIMNSNDSSEEYIPNDDDIKYCERCGKHNQVEKGVGYNDLCMCEEAEYSDYMANQHMNNGMNMNNMLINMYTNNTGMNTNNTGMNINNPVLNGITYDLEQYLFNELIKELKINSIAYYHNVADKLMIKFRSICN